MVFKAIRCLFAAALGAVASIVVLSPPTVMAAGLSPEQFVSEKASPGAFPIVQGTEVTEICVDVADWPGVIRATGDLQADIERVSGHKPVVANKVEGAGKHVIIAGTVGKSPLIDGLAKAGKVDVAKIAGKWESFVIEVVSSPLPGVESALVIAGSDKRGTIYGIYEVSEQIGESPWYWWADVTPRHSEALFVKAGRYEQGEPSVKYRGIFINDESPDLSNWVTEKFGRVPGINNVANYDSRFYARIFEVILRLKGNYLWPAMWNNAFNEDDPNNAKMADEYGIVMGTSHQEPMLRAQKEWDRRHPQSWNYFTDAKTLQDFWREGITRNKNYESILTLGLRGANDTPMIQDGTQQQSMDLLKEIIAAQRKMIAEEINPDVTKVPQLWCPYKEVLDYYNTGLRVPEDVTLLWTDDNWGNLRRLPTDDERGRAGGAGIYYHFDYVGGPRNYKWINTNPLPKIWEQMSLAKAYGADRIWIVNVGHFKGLELPLEYFMRLAWDSNSMSAGNIGDYTKAWAAREFGPEHAADIADILAGYTRINGRRKPELLEPAMYSLTNYHEAETLEHEGAALVALAEKINGELPENLRDAFFELVLFPTKACVQVEQMYIAAGRNALFATQDRASANDQATHVEELFKADSDLMYTYNHTLGGGKWDHFMDQAHIGYTNWQDPPRNVMPRVARLQVPAAASLGVVIEGSAAAWPGTGGDAILPRFDSLNRQQRFIDIFNRGQTAFDFTATASEPWIMLSDAGGKIEKDQRIAVSIDWSKAPQGTASGAIRIARAGGESLMVRIESFNPPEITRDALDGFAEGDGVVSMEAEHFSRNIPAGAVHWEKIDGYGHTLSAMTIMPRRTASVTPPHDSPCLEYKMYLFDKGNADVTAFVGPSLNFLPGRGLRCAISFDEQPPQVITLVPENFNAQNGNREWETSVKDNGRYIHSTHIIAAPGYHTLKFWMVDPAVTLEKLVVDFGGGKPSYLGPPESFRHQQAAAK